MRMQMAAVMYLAILFILLSSYAWNSLDVKVVKFWLVS